MTLFMSFDEFKESLGSWQEPLKGFIESNTFQQIYKFVKSEYESGKKVYPPQQLIFNAFKATPIQNVKVVIVGQDPYHQPGQAHGLCFSVMKPVRPPPSLVNIYKNLEADPNIDFKRPQHGDLTKWAQQGVFMLNAALTVIDSQPDSHKKCGWLKFTDAVINAINKNCSGVVYLLWGKPAQDKASSVNHTKNKVLKTTHPSPLSASKGFLTSRHFSECNEYLKSIGKEPIDWKLDEWLSINLYFYDIFECE